MCILYTRIAHNTVCVSFVYVRSLPSHLKFDQDQFKRNAGVTVVACPRHPREVDVYPELRCVERFCLGTSCNAVLDDSVRYKSKNKEISALRI